jgi:hypothetical protein
MRRCNVHSPCAVGVRQEQLESEVRLHCCREVERMRAFATYQGFLGVGRLAGGFFFAGSLRGGGGVWVGFRVNLLYDSARCGFNATFSCACKQ